jgi:hypothetical protein
MILLMTMSVITIIDDMWMTFVRLRVKGQENKIILAKRMPNQHLFAVALAKKTVNKLFGSLHCILQGIVGNGMEVV